MGDHFLDSVKFSVIQILEIQKKQKKQQHPNKPTTSLVFFILEDEKNMIPNLFQY